MSFLYFTYLRANSQIISFLPHPPFQRGEGTRRERARRGARERRRERDEKRSCMREKREREKREGWRRDPRGLDLLSLSSAT